MAHAGSFPGCQSFPFFPVSSEGFPDGAGDHPVMGCHPVADLSELVPAAVLCFEVKLIAVGEHEKEGILLSRIHTEKLLQTPKGLSGDMPADQRHGKRILRNRKSGLETHPLYLLVQKGETEKLKDRLHIQLEKFPTGRITGDAGKQPEYLTVSMVNTFMIAAIQGDVYPPEANAVADQALRRLSFFK